MRDKPLTRDAIKAIAMGMMTLNHISQMLMTSGTFWAELFLDLGWFTAITMCYFLVEGYGYTHDKRRYALRLAIFAVLSQPVYVLAFPESGGFVLNMLFTLLLCFGLLVCRARIKQKVLRLLVTLAFIACSVVCDWGILAPLYTLLFAWAGRDTKKRTRAFLLAILFFGVMNVIGGLGRFMLPLNLGYALAAMSGQALAMVAICGFYNGRRATRGRRFWKWFFYLFYPAHLLVLSMLRMWLGL